GKTVVAESSSSKLVAYLRTSGDENLLILLNVADNPITNYSITLSSGPLSGTYNAASLLDDAALAPLSANAKGGFDAYTPLAEIPAYGVLIIQLTQ
ncbi:MAG: hypothetical protein AB1846_18490, partial [Chloroflexota bacterium]